MKKSPSPPQPPIHAYLWDPTGELKIKLKEFAGEFGIPLSAIFRIGAKHVTKYPHRYKADIEREQRNVL